MITSNKNINVWYSIISTRNECVEEVHSFCRKNNVTLSSFEASSPADFGIIFLSGSSGYVQLISFLTLQAKQRGNRIIVINSSNIQLAKDETLKILHYGAEYVFESSVINTQLHVVTEIISRWRNIESILQSSLVKKTIAGESGALKKLLRGVIETAVYSDASVLIMGERGTGKELIARVIHELQQSKIRGELVLVDCTTIRKELSGSEFFGHEKGSYTGADQSREGAFSLANNGTLFLDEVGELPLLMQAELLRVIQERTYKKVGSNIWRQVNFRLVCATNRDLEKECEAGNFRKDLYDRISLWKCHIPSMEARKEDVPVLTQFFLKKSFPESTPVPDEAVLTYLSERKYPGNIRELQNLIKRICMRYIGKGPVTLGDIPDYDRCMAEEEFETNWYENTDLTLAIANALKQGFDAKQIVDTIKSLTTKIALSIAGNNREMSQLLGKSERWIQLQRAKEKE